MSEEIKRTKVELIKEASQNLRGTIAEDLKDDSAYFPVDQTQLLKFHGIYQQDDRDVRKERMRQKQEVG